MVRFPPLRFGTLALTTLTAFILSTLVVPPCASLRQFTPVNGISVTGESTVFNIENGTSVFGFRIQSQIPTSTVVLGYVQRSGAVTNATLALAPGNSSMDGWWQVRIEPRYVQQTFPNGTRTYVSEAMTLYVSNNNGTTMFQIEQGEMSRTSVSSFSSINPFQPTVLTALVMVGIIVGAIVILYSRRQSRHPPTTTTQS
ncbi:MAG TPA: hypothetical protein VFE98_02190 [Candidatus Bathyarchaeia archaeon]|nr:hypothetical protein [Candidatus Bathyarchaeia archaeon]